MNKSKYILVNDSVNSLYTSIIQPHLIYYVEECGNACKGNLYPLYVRQKRLIRLITKSGELDHTANRLQSLNILPICLLIKCKIGILMHKVYHRMFPLTILKLFTHYYSHYLTRHGFTSL